MAESSQARRKEKNDLDGHNYDQLGGDADTKNLWPKQCRHNVAAKVMVGVPLVFEHRVGACPEAPPCAKNDGGLLATFTAHKRSG